MPVGLFVDAENEFLQRTLNEVPLGMIQLHGNESPARVAEIRAKFGLPVMKAIRIACGADLEIAARYEDVSDRLLFDASPPSGASLPGGNGVIFDWMLLAGCVWKKPWMLSGGLNARNVAEAIRITGAMAVDVSSGVEDRPGHKDSDLIRQFIVAAAGKE